MSLPYENYLIWLKFHWSLFTKGQTDNKSALVQVIMVMAWNQAGNKLLPEPMLN